MDIFEPIKIITLFSLAFFSLFLFSYKSGNRKSNFMLACIYGFQALETLNGTFYRFFAFWSTNHPWVFYTTEFTFFLWGPAMYYFFLFNVKREFNFHKKQLLHLAPALLHLLFLCYKFHFMSNAAKTALLQTGVMSETVDLIIHSLRNISVLIYLGLSALLIFKSISLNKKNLKWLSFFLVVFLIVELIQLLHFVDLETHTYNTLIYNTTSPMWFLIAITSLFLTMRDPHFLVFNLDKEEVNEEIKYTLDKKELDSIISKIDDYLLKKENYTDPELSLQSLADAIGIHSKKTSMAINQHYESNFPDYINSLRIKQVTKILLDTNNDQNIIEIAYSVGFSSKSTFNRVFTKFTSLTPSEYLKRHSIQ